LKCSQELVASSFLTSRCACAAVGHNKINVRLDWLTRNDGDKPDLIATALAFRQNRPAYDDHGVRETVRVMMDAIDAGARSNIT